jgi:two-component system NarL family sensor kinase
MTTATASTQDLDRIVAEHARRGAALHVRLRGILVTFVAVTVLWEPPQYFAMECRLLAAGYVLWAIGVAIWFRRDPAHMVRLSWLVLTVDLLLFGVLNQLTGVSDRLSWTPYILVNGFLLVPLLAAAQLRPTLGIAIGAGTTALYLLSSIAAQQANGDPGTDGEPWSSIVLRTFVVAGVSVGAVLLSRVQRGRVADIARLAGQRAELLSQLSSLENRQRRELAEALHDGALQYLLGARLELEEARDTGNSDAFDRVDEALTSSAQLLRSTVGELHPAVLAQAGLARRCVIWR